MTPSEWLQANLSAVVIAVAQAGASVAGSTSELSQTASAHLHAGLQDE